MKKDKSLLDLVKEFYLICPYCERKMPNLKFRRKKGCKWCQKKQ